jgi:hypothetical protein
MVTTVVNGGGGGVTSLLGTVNQVAVSASTGAVTLSLPANVDLTGVPTAPTAAPGTNTTQLATTAFVTSAVAAGGGSSGASTIHPMFIIGGV